VVSLDGNEACLCKNVRQAAKQAGEHMSLKLRRGFGLKVYFWTLLTYGSYIASRCTVRSWLDEITQESTQSERDKEFISGKGQSLSLGTH
jgi:hypothetical protein